MSEAALSAGLVVFVYSDSTARNADGKNLDRTQLVAPVAAQTIQQLVKIRQAVATAITITMGIIANSLMKAVIAFGIGKRRFALQAGSALIAMAAAAAASVIVF